MFYNLNNTSLFEIGPIFYNNGDQIALIEPYFLLVYMGAKIIYLRFNCVSSLMYVIRVTNFDS